MELARSFRHSGAGLRIARELISRKLAGQEQVVRDKLLDSATAQVIAGFRAEVDCGKWVTAGSSSARKTMPGEKGV